MKKLLTFVLGTLGCWIVCNAQDPHLSQFYSNTLYTNPAFTGTSGYHKFAMTGRKQFTNVTHSTYTSVASADLSIKKTNSGVGMIAMFDRSGSSAYTTSSLGAIYSYHTKVSSNVSVSAAVQGGLVNRSLDRSNLQFADQMETELGVVRDTRENISSTQRFYPNFAAGMLVYTKNFFSGFVVHNIAEPNQAFINTTSRAQENLHLRRYTVHLGMNIPTNKYLKRSAVISPNILCMAQGKATEVNLGFYLRKAKITTGLWLRQTMNNSDALILMAGYRFDKLTVGYSYDLGIGRLSGNIKSAHEITLQFDMKPKDNYKMNSIRHLRIPCPNL
jgi:type IX secretion system PorP/SprF family membrane protein